MFRLIVPIVVFFMLLVNTTQSHKNPDIEAITPTPTEEFLLDNIFTERLACAFAEPGDGPMWGEIEVGRSTFTEFREIYGVEYQIEVDDSSDSSFTHVVITNPLSLSYDYRMCVVDGVIVAIEGFPPPVAAREPIPVTHDPTIPIRPVLIEDYVARFGVPDAVTYTFSPTDRVAFWFDEGFAIVVYARHSGEEAMFGVFGEVTQIIYYPFQPLDDYESRWPYNRTYPDWIYVSDSDVPSERNPFDFDRMIATLTTMPAMTITPTP